MGFWPKKFARVSKTTFHVFQEPFWSFVSKKNNKHKNVSLLWVKIDGPVQLKVCQVVATAFCMPREKMCEITVFFRKSRSLWGNSDFEQKIFGRLVKTAFIVRRGIFGGFLLCAKKFFAYNLGPSAKICCQVCRNFLQCVPEKFKSNEFSLENFKLFINVWILSEKWKNSERKKFCRFDKNCVSPLSRTTLKRISEKRISKFFLKFVGKKFRWIAKIFRRLLKLHFACLEKKCERKPFFFRKKRSISRNPDVDQEIFGRLVKTAFNVCRGIFGGNLCFSKKFSQLIWDLPRKFVVTFVETAFIVSPEKTTNEKLSLARFYLYTTVWILSANWNSFRQKKSVGLTKLRFTCPENHLEEFRKTMIIECFLNFQ